MRTNTPPLITAYDVIGNEAHVLAVVARADASAWLGDTDR